MRAIFNTLLTHELRGGARHPHEMGEKEREDGIAEYRRQKNAISTNGLPTGFGSE